VVLTHCDEVSAEEKQSVLEKLGELTDAGIFEAFYIPVGMSALSGRVGESLVYLQGKEVFAFCGIGRPTGFFSTLEKLGCQVAGTRVFRDHHVYSAADIAGIEGEAAHYGAQAVVTTQKDAARLRDMVEPGCDIYCVRVRLKIEDVEKLIQLVKGDAGGK
jgi:tetraacyldisaccharide 4'-kinase